VRRRSVTRLNSCGCPLAISRLFRIERGAVCQFCARFTIHSPREPAYCAIIPRCGQPNWPDDWPQRYSHGERVAVGVNEILAMLSGLSSVACASSDRRMPRHGAVPHWRLLKRSAAVALQRCWSRFLRSRTVEISRTPRPQGMEISQSEVDWVISLAGQPVGQPDPKNPTALRGPVGVWNCESSDGIRR